MCDLVGEKLDEDQVARTLQALLAPDAHALLVPEATTIPPRYRLLTDRREPRLPERLDRKLQAGHRYREAQLLAQLDAPQLTALPDARRIVHDVLIADGMSAGDIKEKALQHSPDRAARLSAAARPGWRYAGQLNEAD